MPKLTSKLLHGIAWLLLGCSTFALVSEGYAQALSPKAPAAASSAARTYSSVDAFVTSVGESVVQFAQADLDGDGIPDWVGVVQSARDPNYFNAPETVYVLLGQAGGGYKLAGQSRSETESGMGCCYVDGVTIERGTFVIAHMSKSATTGEVASHRFRWDGTDWQLTGRTIVFDNLDQDFSITHDWNLLTGLEQVQRTNGGRKLAMQTHKKPAPRQVLADYDFSHEFGDNTHRPGQ